MSGVIDKNVVQMVFDNTLFQQNAQNTLSTLDKLKEALNFEGVVKGLDNLGNNVRNVGMDSLYNGVYKVQEGFNALDVVATRVLQNITDKVQSVATDLVEKITVEPLKAGIQEYETQINSVQTILANTNDALIEQGLTTEHDRIEKVNGVLDDLNKYADMTIYNFTEMTRNIGTFTAAGVELDTAATAIKGIANLAAMSGSNSQQASTAMYQLSQAIASGSVKLQDWNSVVNAGMGGKLFQNELIDTAKAMGVADEQFIALTEGATTFRESLSSGWISAEVLTNTLEKFTAGSEGYTKSQVEQMQQLWRARGYSEEQIKSLTGSITQLSEEQEANLRTKWAEKGFSEEQIDHILSMGTAATDAATKVKTFTQLLDTVGEALQSGWTQSWEYIIGDFEQAKMLWTEVSDIMNTYISKSADARNTALEEWSKAAYSYNEAGQLIRVADGQIVEGGKMVAKEMGGREAIIQGLRNAFQGLFEVTLQFGQAWDSGFWGKGTDKDISINGEKLIELSRRFHNFTQTFKDSLTGPDGPTELLLQLRQSFDRFATSMRTGFDGIRNVASGVGNVLSGFFKSSFFSIDSLNSLVTVVSAITGRVRDFGNAISYHFGPDKDFKNLNGLTKFFDGIQSDLETGFWVKIDFITNAFEALGDVINHLISPFGTASQLLGSIGTKLEVFVNAFDTMVNDEDVSKFETFFHGLAEGFNSFIDIIRENVDFSGFSKLFNTIVETMTDDMIEPFKIFENVFGGLIDIFKAFIGIASPAAAAFANVFGTDYISKFVQFIRDLSDRFKSLTESLIPTGETMSALQHVFEGAFNILKAVGDVIMNVVLAAWDSLGDIFGKILPQGNDLNESLTNLGDRFNKIAEVIESLVSGENGTAKLSDIIANLTTKITNLFDAFQDINLLEKFLNLLGKIGDGIKHALGGTEDMTLFDTIIEKIKGFLDGIKRILSDENGQLDMIKVFEAGGIGVVLKKLVEMLTDLKKNTGNISGIVSFINDIKEAFIGLSEAFQEKFKAESIKTIATSFLEIAGALFIVAMIDPVALATAIGTVKAMFVMIEQLLLSLKGFSKADAAILAAVAGVIQTLGNSVIMMAGAIAIIGSMNVMDAIEGIMAIGVMLQSLVWVVKELSTIEKDIPKVAGALIALAIAIDLLTISVVALGNMDLISLAKGLAAVAAMMYILVTAVGTLSKTTKDANLMAIGFGLIEIATAMRILAGSLKVMGEMDLVDLAKGLVTFGIALGGMVYASKVVSSGGKDGTSLADDMIAVGGAMVLLGLGMVELAAAGKIMSGVNWEDLGKMAAVFVVGLVGLGVASYAINGANLLMIAGAIALVATAFLELNAALGLAQIVGPLCTSIGMAIEGMSHSLESFAHSAARDAFLQFLKDAILFLPELAVGLANAVIAMIVALGEGASKIVGAVVKIGQAILQGLVQLIPELFNLVRTFIEQVIQLVIDETPRLFEALGVIFEQIWGFLATQVPRFFEFLTTVFTELLMFLQAEAPLLIETIAMIIDTLLQAIITEAPVIGETLLTLLHTLLEIIGTAIPEITNTLLSLITNILQQLAAFVPQMAQAAMEIILGFLQAVADNIGAITESAINIAIAFMQGITEKMPELVDTAFKMIIGFIDGLATAIEENHNALFDAVGHLITAIVEALIDGITHLAGAVGEWFTGSGGILDTIGGFFQDLFDAGANLVQGFIDGITSMPGALWDAACGLANDAWNAITGTLDEHSPSRLTYMGGKNFTLGFINGMSDYSSDAALTSEGMAYGVLGAFNSALEDGADTYVPVIAPVLDDSSVINTLSKINGIDEEVSANFINDLTLNLNSSINALNDRLIDVNSNVISAENKMQNVVNVLDNVVMKQDELYERVDYWLESIEGDTLEIAGWAMKGSNIYMDTGSLVGAIAPEMDQALGRTAILTGRGV